MRCSPSSRGKSRLAYRTHNGGPTMSLTRREMLVVTGTTLAGAALTPTGARGQTPKRGAPLPLGLWAPPHFDPHAAGGLSYKLQIALTFSHSRLVKHKAGPSIVPGTFPVEGDLAESWTQPN